MNKLDTIAAIATAHGHSGVGVIRVSGANVLNLIKHFFIKKLKPRLATNRKIKDKDGNVVDDVIVIYFQGPKSYTGEEMLEIQTHGTPVILETILNEIIPAHARLAKPGEFTERAFLNNKIDLTQAEAVADLIFSSNTIAAKAACASLQGKFSTKITELINNLIGLRAEIEAAIDFPEDEIPKKSMSIINDQLGGLISGTEGIVRMAKKGVKLNEQYTFTVAGKPNVGKSSLINALADESESIVSDIPGTTRDAISYNLKIDSFNITVIDTAGLRESKDNLEIQGIERTKKAIKKSNKILYVVDDNIGFDKIDKEIISKNKIDDYCLVFNKIDISKKTAKVVKGNINKIYVSATKNIGLELLKKEMLLKNIDKNEHETLGTARKRHVEEAKNALELLYTAKKYLDNYQLEIMAEELRVAHSHLAAIIGGNINEDLLDRIFSEFCIGK